jgi:formylglycine-generating enzyme required for sulfatase activity
LGAKHAALGRAGTRTRYFWGDSLGKNNANCDGCGSQWDNKQTAEVGQFRSNAFGLYDMAGNVWQRTEDCWNGNYNSAHDDASAVTTGNPNLRVFRGGSWADPPGYLRTAARYRGRNLFDDDRLRHVGFRVAMIF